MLQQRTPDRTGCLKTTKFLLAQESADDTAAARWWSFRHMTVSPAHRWRLCHFSVTSLYSVPTTHVSWLRVPQRPIQNNLVAVKTRYRQLKHQQQVHGTICTLVCLHVRWNPTNARLNATLCSQTGQLELCRFKLFLTANQMYVIVGKKLTGNDDNDVVNLVGTLYLPVAHLRVYGKSTHLHPKFSQNLGG